MARIKTPTCQWCGQDIVTTGRGRPRKFCKPSCKQRAYEQRHTVQGTQIPPTAVIIPPEKVDAFNDALFELRCAAEDIQTAVREGCEPDELTVLCEELVSLAKHVENLRLR
ncbi:hypothetical protein [Corynebacterium sp. HS2168-gen11]|uniref:hypothetical protein n=1 Tax=Corynebacterium sp. HS2168-gen11 TaxID=2974027 RepID=UPI00216AFDB5|nr:hypothetical protein [Corynebacterium sp. HS2168-gen11]MCS4535063.1 hypothetical protein [Corynebacterium sp. HS2168-gen11]